MTEGDVTQGWGGRPKAAPTSTEKHLGRGGLRPPAAPIRNRFLCGARRPGAPMGLRRDTHHKGGRKIEMPPFPVPPAQAVTAGAGAPWGRKDAGRRRTPHSAPIPKSPFFFGFQKPFLFPAGKKKWVLRPSLSSPDAPSSAPVCALRRLPPWEEGFVGGG